MLYFIPISKASQAECGVESEGNYESFGSLEEEKAGIPGLPARLSHHTILLRLLRAPDLATPTGVQIPDWFLNVHDSTSGIDRFVNATNPQVAGGVRQTDRNDELMNSEHQNRPKARNKISPKRSITLACWALTIPKEKMAWKEGFSA